MSVRQLLPSSWDAEDVACKTKKAEVQLNQNFEMLPFPPLENKSHNPFPNSTGRILGVAVSLYIYIRFIYLFTFHATCSPVKITHKTAV